MLGLLPGPAAAADTVSGAELRAGVVQRVDDIMNVEWSLESRISKSIKGDDLAAFQAGGILPTTYFEYVRLHFSYRGVMVESEPATLEEFAEKLLFEYNCAVVPGNAFGDCGEGFVRISYAYSLDHLYKGLECIKKMIDNIKQD